MVADGGQFKGVFTLCTRIVSPFYHLKFVLRLYKEQWAVGISAPFDYFLWVENVKFKSCRERSNREQFVLCSNNKWARFDWYRTTRAVVKRLNEIEGFVTLAVLPASKIEASTRQCTNGLAALWIITDQRVLENLVSSWLTHDSSKAARLYRQSVQVMLGMCRVHVFPVVCSKRPF